MYRSFLVLLLEKKIRLSVKTKVPNRLLLVLGVISHRTKSPFVLSLTFLFFTPHVRHFSCFHVSNFLCEDFFFVFGGISEKFPFF